MLILFGSILKLRAQDNVENFLLDQILHDVRELSRCLGRSVDDIFVLLHDILHNVRKNTVRNEYNITFF